VKKQYKGKVRAAAFVVQSKVPAIIYGGGAEPVAVTLELRELVKALEEQRFL